MAAGEALSVRIARKSFGGVDLLRDFSLQVGAGTTLALLGPSGVGKSSLLRMLAGIDTEFDGAIEIGGRPAARARQPGFVFQDPRLLPWLDARANVRAAAHDVDAARADALLAQVGLAGRAGALPHELSGGMQRRVALARAMATRPSLLLLDEPFVSLDDALVADLQALLLEVIARDRPTVVLVSHASRDAARLADRIVTLAGRPVRVVDDVTPEAPPAARDAAERRSVEERLMPGGVA